MEEPARAAAATRPATDWARAADGIGLAGFAVFLLLNTTGRLPWSFWLDALALWPVLLMSAGLKIAFEKSRVPWLVLLGPVLVLGTLAWLATGARPEAPAGPWQVESLSRPEGTKQVQLDADLTGAGLSVATSRDLPSGRLVDGRSQAGEGAARFDVSAEEGTARVRLHGGNRFGLVFQPRPRERWQLTLPTDLPLSLRVKGVGLGAVLDLADGAVEGTSVDGVFLRVTARLPAPAVDTELQLKGVFNSLTLVVPDGTPVRVHGAGLPFNAVDRGVRGLDGHPGYDVSVLGIFTAVDVRSEARPQQRPVATAPPPEATPSPTPRPKAEAEPAR